MARIYNFSAGPAVMPEEVLVELQKEMLEYKDKGMSVMEMSHRSKMYEEIFDEVKADLKKLMNIPDNYKILFIQGGGHMEFAMVPMNLIQGGSGDYIVTGEFSGKAFKEAKIFGNAVKVASSEDKNFSYIPDCSDLPISADSKYVYICENNTIYGTKFWTLPNTKGVPLVSDQSSCFLSGPVDVSKYGIIYAGVQKNVGPAGMSVCIIREDLVTDNVVPNTPTMLKYSTYVENDSMFNTPNTYCIYVCGKVFKHLLNMGGLAAIQEKNQKKAKLLYDYLDNSKLFKSTVAVKDRSMMNVPFVTGSDELDKKFVAEAKVAGLENIKGHRKVGGMRASIYNAMPYAGVQALVDFMHKFEKENM